MIVTAGLIGIISAIAIPVFMESNARSNLWTGSELIGATIRQARMKAIGQNTTYRVVFSCPSANTLRTLIVTGDTTIDDASDRCDQTVDGDTGIIEMPASVTYTPGSATRLEINGRGTFTATGDAVPLTINVNYGSTLRTLTVSATGQITFSNVE
jgi:Tfp pilus assembly protein FimT